MLEHGAPARPRQRVPVVVVVQGDERLLRRLRRLHLLLQRQGDLFQAAEAISAQTLVEQLAGPPLERREPLSQPGELRVEDRGAEDISSRAPRR